jgi:TonB dependent receptor/TonB-dependent Receptor Plug Domain
MMPTVRATLWLMAMMLVPQLALSQATTDVVLPVTLTTEVTVTGWLPLRDLADVENPSENLIGIADAASEGAVTAKQLERRPLSRPGEVLETVPGLVISQHSGEGKANQYYLRGFNLDHGTDFAVSVAGIPVNMPTHAHGQGWSDVNFLIPELVSGVQFKKGPYYADEGDFSTAGAANINYVNALERPLLRLTAGGNRFGRMLAAASPKLASGNLLVAVETGSADGPWENPEEYRRLNGVVRYSRGDTRQGPAVTFMGYDAKWTATDQVPERAVTNGLISRFGTLDASDGGKTHRYTLSAEVQRSGTVSTTKVLGFAMDYGLDLFSNFTYLLNDPVNGDQFEQVDNRRVFGVRGSHRRRGRLFGRALEHRVGLQVRHDRIGPLGLFATRQRQRLSVTREDRVKQTSTGVYYQTELELTDRFRVATGVRGDLYHFDVRSSARENAGTESAGLLSPKLGVVFAPSTKLELYGNFGYGYHSNDARGTTITIDPATGKPADRVTPLVRTRGGELGVRSILIPKVQTTVAVWGLTLDSELVFVGDAGTTEAGRPSRRFGVEWANYYSPRPWLMLDADISLSSARFSDANPVGSQIPGAVRQVASAGVSISELRRLSGGLRLRYLGPRPNIEDASVQAKRSLLVNAEAVYRLAAGTRLAIDVLNLFDSRVSDIDYYYPSRLPGDPPSGVADVHTHPIAPRTARVSLRFDF